MPRVTFDTMVFVRSLMSPYGLWGRLVFDYADRYQLVVSQPVLVEVLELLRRPRLTAKYRAVATRHLDVLLRALEAAEIVEPATIAPVCRDPKDDKFLATAKAAGAEYLISEDRDLLDLGEYEGTPIITAEQFLGLLTD